MMKKIHHEASCVVSLLPCVGRANARDPHTKDSVEEATGDGGRGSLRDGPSSRVAVTRDHASLPLSRKTADTTEHTLLHPQAPRSQQEFTRARQHSAQHQRARHELLSVRGRSVVVFRSASASPTSSLVSSARVVRPSSRVAVTRDHASLPLSRKTADTTEHTLLHPQAPRSQQEFTHSLTRSTVTVQRRLTDRESLTRE